MGTRLRAPCPHKNTKKRDAFEEWLYRKKEEDTGDEFCRYSIAGSAIPVSEKFGQADIEEAFPILQRWALDVFACPATSCECERAFSSAKKLIHLKGTPWVPA